MPTVNLSNLTVERLEELRTRLQRLGERPSMRFPTASPEIIEVMTTLERFGPLCEAMYLMMAADGKVTNVEREVLRGALEIVADGQVRTAHMEAMLDAASKASATEGVDAQLERVVTSLCAEPIKAELAVVLCAVVAIADGDLKPQERALFDKLSEGLEITTERANELLSELVNSGSPEKG